MSLAIDARSTCSRTGCPEGGEGRDAVSIVRALVHLNEENKVELEAMVVSLALGAATIVVVTVPPLVLSLFFHYVYTGSRDVSFPFALWTFFLLVVLLQVLFRA